MSDKEKEVKKAETPEVDPKLQGRLDAFLKEYKALTIKHKVDIAAYPVWVPDGAGGFKNTIQSTPVDITHLGQESPFVKAEK